MKLFDGFEAIVKENEPLSKHTWFRIGGPARYFIEPTTFDELCRVTTRCRENSVPIHVLGGGANLLVADAGVPGAVIRLAGEEFQRVTFEENTLTAGAAAEMGKVVLRCVREGRSGLEGLTGVPGTIGGCVRMNAGGAFGDIGSTIECVTVMDEEGNTFQRFRPDLAFAYRSTNITARFILSATFGLTEDDPHRILREVKQIWMHKKNTQPLAAHNAGCIFKNPRGMSAGALIDKAGMKGRRVGGARVSEKHANFILAEKGTTAFDVLRLIDMIREAVAREFNVNLEKEIEVW
ncbi:MAG: UDP-N-acetylmuramate dehydrogenase [Phycisphaerae bacterium]|nr:UDP-N-acetylmuramate dehydrogenase [Phycisphaerae bacterium]